MANEVPESFHPAVKAWFERRFPAGPTDAQEKGWSFIAAGADTLIAAPTGSGKTLAGFLVAIDACMKAGVATDKRLARTSVVYVSPLRALTVDVRENLERPLHEMAEIASELGIEMAPLRVAVRNGDTTAAARAAMLREPPEILVTTPESLYLLTTSTRGREMLSGVSTVIIDEIHAVARDKRGAHLSLTLERLDRLVCSTRPGAARPARVGLSATQRPIGLVASLLTGVEPATGRARPCAIVDVGHERSLDVKIELGRDELGAVMTNEQLDDMIASLAKHLQGHRSSLVFVNTRRMAERVAHLLGEVLEEEVSAHHGSLSMDRRLAVEERLRNGELKAVVATASLELGIDVGPIDLVCQLGSPRSIATFLQRVGRAEHRVGGVAKGRLYPFTRDELVECVALLWAVRSGELDTIVAPRAPLDILAQQIVAECAAAGEDGILESELKELVTGASPYRLLPESDLEEAITLVSEGVATGRGRRGAYVHRDAVHAVLRPRRGARLVATTSGGAIPDLSDFKVVLEPEGAVIGTVNEDFAVESMAGDVFLLGSSPWRIVRIEQGTVRVVDAEGAAPTIPFWFGEAPARTDELSGFLSLLRARVDEALASSLEEAITTIMALSGVERRVAAEVAGYLATARRELGGLPTRDELVLERFFDESGGMQLVVHSPYGARVNRGFGLALRKRFCRTFDFELQAAASDDAIVLSLGPQHSFALEEVSRFLSPKTVRDVVVQAVLPTQIFTSRWRWNLSRSLVSPRFRGARKLAPQIQRMEADDLMAAIFPMLAACQENVSGPIEIPDHLIVRQTLEDCLNEAMDIDALTGLVGGLRSGEIAMRFVDTVEASVLSHEILNGRPYTFLDDAPLEERRTRAVTLRRGLPLEAHDLSVLDPEVVAEVTAEVAPAPRDAEELHDLLLGLVLTSPEASYRGFQELVGTGRAMTATIAGRSYWCATESRAVLEAAYETVSFSPDHELAPEKRGPAPEPELARATIVEGRLECSGPLLAAELAEATGLAELEVTVALAALEHKGAVLRVLGERYAVRRVVARIHERTRRAERRGYRAVSPGEFMRFLLSWQHAAPGTKLSGIDGLAEVVSQLQGYELAVGAWEDTVLPGRIEGYHTMLLDELATNGELAWGRLSRREDDAVEKRSGSSPSRATPVALARRQDLGVLLAACRLGAEPNGPGSGATAEVVEALAKNGAMFFAELCEETGRLAIEVSEALWDGVSRGMVTADGFRAVRALLSGRYKKSAPHRSGRARHSLSGHPLGRAPLELSGGRWSLLVGAAPSSFLPDELAEAVATQLLRRWGVLYKDLVQREPFALSWREILWALRRLEARGVARGGRFVTASVGEQFGLPEALEQLYAIAATKADGTRVTLSGADPLNLTGVLFDGPRVAALRTNELVLVDGVPLRSAEVKPAAALVNAAS